MQNDKEKFKKEFIERLVKLSIKSIKFGDKLKEEKISFCVVDQFIRAITSIGANVVEAKSSHSVKDYIKFFEIALKSGNESKYWLIIIKELTGRYKQEAQEILNEVIEICKILGSGVLTMKGRK